MEHLINEYKNIIQKELESRVIIPIANTPSVNHHLIINDDRTEFILLAIGWHNKVYRHRTVFHIGIVDNKICIYADNTDVGIADKLVENGIPKSAIFLFFLPEYAREISGFSAA